MWHNFRIVSVETLKKTSISNATSMGSHIAGLEIVEGIALFGSVARNGEGNDLDIAIEVPRTVYERYIKRRHRLIGQLNQYFDVTHMEMSLITRLLGLESIGRWRHLEKDDYPENLGDVEPLIVPVGWRNADLIDLVQAEYGLCDPDFMDNVRRDALEFDSSAGEFIKK